MKKNIYKIFHTSLLALIYLTFSTQSMAFGANEALQIQLITAEGNIVIFELNNSPAAKDFYKQLPLKTWIDDYAGDEKIFYPPEKLNTNNSPLAKGPAGTLAYYAPWGNVVIYYGQCSGASGLYSLGEAISGLEYLANMSGEINIQKY